MCYINIVFLDAVLPQPNAHQNHQLQQQQQQQLIEQQQQQQKMLLQQQQQKLLEQQQLQAQQQLPVIFLFIFKLLLHCFLQTCS